MAHLFFPCSGLPEQLLPVYLGVKAFRKRNIRLDKLIILSHAREANPFLIDSASELVSGVFSQCGEWWLATLIPGFSAINFKNPVAILLHVYCFVLNLLLSCISYSLLLGCLQSSLSTWKVTFETGAVVFPCVSDVTE